MQTFTGRTVYPLDMTPDDVDIVDIAHSLALQCRYIGHCVCHYGVAEHSVRVCDCVRSMGVESRHDLLYALLHDASEAYLCDVPKPIKSGTELGALYKVIEERVEGVIREHFGLAIPLTNETKTADRVLLVTEKRDIMPPGERPWNLVDKPLPMTIEPWSWRTAEERFLERFWELTDGR